MLSRWFFKWSRRFINAATCFLREPMRAVAAAGFAFGILFVILVAILTSTMFVKTAPLAATVAPLLHNVILGVLALIGIIALTFLGYRNVTASFAGATVTVSADDVENARGGALETVQKVAEALTPDDPS